jgi:hypothetical protein
MIFAESRSTGRMKMEKVKDTGLDMDRAEMPRAPYRQECVGDSNVIVVERYLALSMMNWFQELCWLKAHFTARGKGIGRFNRWFSLTGHNFIERHKEAISECDVSCKFEAKPTLDCVEFVIRIWGQRDFMFAICR